MLRADQLGPVVFVDLDSTLADTTHRQHLLGDRTVEDLTAYSLACADDTPFAGTVRLTQLLKGAGAHVVIVTSRYDVAMMETMRWLYRHNVGFSELIMQAADDASTIEDFKVVAIERWLANNGVDAPELVIEDWPPIKDALEAKGWTVMLVNPNYHPDEYVAAHR